jgi:hypothetical protein
MDRFSETDPMNYAARNPGDDWQDEADDSVCTARGHHPLPTTAPSFRREAGRIEVRRAAVKALGSERK